MIQKGARICVAGIIVLLALVAGALLYLHAVGVPRWACDRWIAAQEARQIFLEVDRVTFNVLDGLVARKFAYFETAQHELPLLEAQRVDLQFRLEDWLRGRQGWQGMTVEKGTVRISPGSSLTHAQPNQILTLQNLAGTVSWKEDILVVDALSGELLGMHVRGKGRVLLSAGPGAGPPRLTAADPAPGVASEAPHWIPELVSQLNQVSFGSAPRVEVTFDISARDLPASTARIEGSGEGTRVRGGHFDRWRVVMEYDHGTLRIDEATLSHGDQQVQASLRYELDRKEVAGSIACDLPPAHWQSLLPGTWRERMTELGFRFSGPTRWTVEWGPATLDRVWHRLAGSLDTEKAEVRGVWLEQFRCRFESGPDGLHLSDLESSVGVGGEHGSVRGTFDWLYEDGRYRGDMQSDLDFAGLAPILNEHQLSLARSYQLDDRPLSADVRFEGQKGHGEAFRVHGDVSATNIFYRGAHIRRGRTQLTVSNQVVQLDDLHVERDEGAVDGFLRLDFEEKVVALNMSGSMDAKAIGRVSGASVERTLRNFDFSGPIHGRVQGEIHTADRPQTDLLIQAAGDGIALRAYRSDHLGVDILWTNNVIDVRSFQADIYEGTVTGSYQVVFRDRDLPPRYRLSAEARSLTFEDLVRTMAHREGEPYRGRISGAVELEGVLAAGHGAEAVGTGSIEIAAGRIMSIPVFGGLSRGLSKIYPGLGFARQTDFLADFRVRDMHLHSRNVQLEGGIFSLRGKGKYGLVDKSLDFDVEFKLLREGNVGAVVRIVTLPITKLLTFDLEGTLKDPRWRPKNLPREVFDIFE